MTTPMNPDPSTAPTLIPVRARWQRPSGRPMWGDYEYALVVSLPGGEVVFEVGVSPS